MVADDSSSTGEWDAEPDFEMARPFLDRIARTTEPQRAQAPVPEPEGAVRPYYITGGRTRSRNETISFETIVALGDTSVSLSRLSDEARAVAHRASIPHSMAELSALLHLPIGVVWVLAGDLADSGYLTVYSPPENAIDDIDLIDSLIEGLKRL